MTDQQIRERCQAFLRDPRHEFEQNSANGKPYEFQVAALESLCREMLAAGLEMAAVIAGGGGFISETSAEARFGMECAAAIRREAQRAKEGA